VQVEIELTPLLAAIQELLGIWEHLPISNPMSERQFEFLIVTIESLYKDEVAALFRQQAKDGIPMNIVED
jgi:hypothetical protein